MQDPAASLHAARTDLSKLTKLLDHVLKITSENEIGSQTRADHSNAFFRLLAHRNVLRREEEMARKALRNECYPPTGFSDDNVDLNDPSLDELDEAELREVRECNRALDTEERFLRELTNFAGMRPLPIAERSRTLDGRP